MTRELLIEAVGYLDSSYLADYDEIKKALLIKKNKRKKAHLTRMLIAAAVILLTMSVLLVSLPVMYVVNRESIHHGIAEAVDTVLFPLEKEQQGTEQKQPLLNWTEWESTEQFFAALGAGQENSLINAMKNGEGVFANESSQQLGDLLDRMYQYYLKYKDDPKEPPEEQTESESESESETEIDPAMRWTAALA